LRELEEYRGLYEEFGKNALQPDLVGDSRLGP
jgi:hypothetical protein